MKPPFRIVPAGDAALLVLFADRIDPAINRMAIALAEAIQAAGLAGVRDVVPTYRSVAIHFDPLRTDWEALVARIEACRGDGSPYLYGDPSPVRVPVCYSGEFAPDLAAVAAFGGITEAEAVRLHTLPTYRVFMLGFSPGFTYMGPVDGRIAAPRLPAPRVRVPAGSVGIAGVQTGIYPAPTPGGWQIVGRTPVKPFDLARREPFLFKPGDAVQFYAIEPSEYIRLQTSG
jgi:KipI family sensor histidine kinase inhibitor